MDALNKIEDKKIFTYIAIGGAILVVFVGIVAVKEIMDARKTAKDKEIVKTELEIVKTAVLANPNAENFSGCSGCGASNASGDYKMPAKKYNNLVDANWVTGK